ncbi:hypothetical protein K503DRAFT_432835 [Rhizopogon vinicolor AM-OR11-026]|uniref:Uncharacterized protein n=1 Tax=Rhizopogon vinicolor AM-OR11-026 TaxID=1314800 RepID=A0A1B7NAX0_9AGAM|nr:hypothetical protein K503DRAFT_432835 [Rhizopogon vinicolor AM-OR11-026]
MMLFVNVQQQGTLKHAQLSAIAHNRKVIAQFRAKAKNPTLYQDSCDDYLRKVLMR